MFQCAVFKEQFQANDVLAVGFVEFIHKKPAGKTSGHLRNSNDRAGCACEVRSNIQANDVRFSDYL